MVLNFTDKDFLVFVDITNHIDNMTRRIFKRKIYADMVKWKYKISSAILNFGLNTIFNSQVLV